MPSMTVFLTNIIKPCVFFFMAHSFYMYTLEDDMYAWYYLNNYILPPLFLPNMYMYMYAVPWNLTPPPLPFLPSVPPLPSLNSVLPPPLSTSPQYLPSPPLPSPPPYPASPVLLCVNTGASGTSSAAWGMHWGMS